MPFPITVFSKNPERETDFAPNLSLLLDTAVIKCSNPSIIKDHNREIIQGPEQRKSQLRRSAAQSSVGE